MISSMPFASAQAGSRGNRLVVAIEPDLEPCRDRTLAKDAEYGVDRDRIGIDRLDRNQQQDAVDRGRGAAQIGDSVWRALSAASIVSE